MSEEDMLTIADEPPELHPYRAMLDQIDPEILCWDSPGFDEAIIGAGYRFTEGPVAVYDKRKLIEALMRDGLTEEDAIEHFEYNIIGGWIGDKTPIVVEVFDVYDY